jgi:hypothetical protein
VVGEAALATSTGLGLEAIDEIDHVVEPTAGATADAASRNGDGKMRLAGASAADQHGVALLGDKSAASEIIDERLVDRRALELEVVEILASGSLAMVSWYLIERACFSLISALSRSPTMR